MVLATSSVPKRFRVPRSTEADRGAGRSTLSRTGRSYPARRPRTTSGSRDPAPPALGRRAWLPPPDQGADQPLQEGRHELARRGLQRPRPTALPALPGRHARPDRRPRTRPHALVLFNTRYRKAAVTQFRADGFHVRDEDITRLSPLRGTTSTCSADTPSGSRRSSCGAGWLRLTFRIGSLAATGGTRYWARWENQNSTFATAQGLCEDPAPALAAPERDGIAAASTTTVGGIAYGLLTRSRREFTREQIWPLREALAVPPCMPELAGPPLPPRPQEPLRLCAVHIDTSGNLRFNEDLVADLIVGSPWNLAKMPQSALLIGFGAGRTRWPHPRLPPYSLPASTAPPPSPLLTPGSPRRGAIGMSIPDRLSRRAVVSGLSNPRAAAQLAWARPMNSHSTLSF